jgi:hypothetical protein
LEGGAVMRDYLTRALRFDPTPDEENARNEQSPGKVHDSSSKPVLSSSNSFHSLSDRGDGDPVEPGPLGIWQCSQCDVKQVEHLQPDSCFDCQAPRAGPACSHEERERGKS